MIKAAGACIIAKDTKRILLQHRSINGSYPRNWAFWGGKIEQNENVSQGLLRLQSFYLQPSFPSSLAMRASSSSILLVILGYFTRHALGSF
mgnify:CR=1 FL=1